MYVYQYVIHLFVILLTNKYRAFAKYDAFFLTIFRAMRN